MRASFGLGVIGMVAGAGSAASAQCEWSALGRGISPGFHGGYALALEAFDDGSGGSLYVGGSFDQAGDELAFNVARWDGRSWSAAGAGLRDGLVYDLTVFDDGAGSALYAAGSFVTSGGRHVQCIAKWDGATWSQVGAGLWPAPSSKATVHALCVHDDGAGPALYAGGWFSSVDGAPETYCIAKWDGASWSSVGGGVGSRVWALATYDNCLYAAGYFKTAGGAPASHLAKWDGQSWSEVGGGLDDFASEFGVFDDGGGPALYVLGRFSRAGGLPAPGMARWDGQSWSDVGGAPGTVAVFDDGRGPALYLGGGFTMVGAIPANRIARRDGAGWEALGAGVGGKELLGVSALAVFDDGAGLALYAAGGFLTAGGVSANNIARWRCNSCPADCDGDGELTFFDFLCFQNLFAAGDPRADCDGDTQFTFFDFLCFQNAFAAGCP